MLRALCWADLPVYWTGSCRNCTSIWFPARSTMASQTRNQLQAKRVAGAAGELFKEGKVDAAVEKYTEALEIIGDEVENEAGIKIKKGILLNRSAVLLKLGQDEFVVDDCVSVLELDPEFLTVDSRGLHNAQLLVRVEHGVPH